MSSTSVDDGKPVEILCKLALMIKAVKTTYMQFRSMKRAAGEVPLNRANAVENKLVVHILN